MSKLTTILFCLMLAMTGWGGELVLKLGGYNNPVVVTTNVISEQTPRYTDNGDGTITDTATGLMWLKDASACGVMAWADGVSFCDSLITNGYGDWRLPWLTNSGLSAELDSLGREHGNPTNAWEGFGGTPFTNVVTNSSMYWSQSSWEDNPEVAAYAVSMSNSYTDYFPKDFSHYIWPVRTPSLVVTGAISFRAVGTSMSNVKGRAQ